MNFEEIAKWFCFLIAAALAFTITLGAKKLQDKDRKELYDYFAGLDKRQNKKETV